MQTKRDYLSDLVIEFFGSIGVKPVVGFTFLITVVVIFRIKNFINDKKEKKQYNIGRMIDDLIIVLLIVIGLYVFL